MKIIAFLLFAGLVLAADKPKPLQEVDKLKIENAQLQAQVVELQGQIAQLEKTILDGRSQQLGLDICKSAGITNAADCLIDMKALTISRRKNASTKSTDKK